ncbi:helix-turn-helix transcriptional regulator [Burkholderia orbicola]|uniref:helix-turn-helix transcriptional regulator n=1 Tax=Burkholderia orbicola TaxID=2978683 RepID=UPI002FE37C75
MATNHVCLRPKAAAQKLGIGVSTLWLKVTKGEPGFPKPIKLGPATTVFLEHELDAYIDQCIQQTRQSTAA